MCLRRKKLNEYATSKNDTQDFFDRLVAVRRSPTTTFETRDVESDLVNSKTSNIFFVILDVVTN